MSANSSSSPDFRPYYCSVSRVSVFINTGVMATRIVTLLPLCSFVLLLGHRRWRRSPPAAASHSDLFLYHLSAMELVSLLGCLLFFAGLYADDPPTLTASLWLFNVVFFGQAFFHGLTCAERYLAAVHPVAYLALRQARWTRVRNAAAAGVWLLSAAMTGVYSSAPYEHGSVLVFCLLVLSLAATSFFSAAVLLVLVRPGPGEGGVDTDRVDRSKRRAFLTIAAIACVLWVRFVGLLVLTALDRSPELHATVVCAVAAGLSIISLPSSLVSPLLYLHKTGKLACCKRGWARIFLARPA